MHFSYIILSSKNISHVEYKRTVFIFNPSRFYFQFYLSDISIRKNEQKQDSHPNRRGSRSRGKAHVYTRKKWQLCGRRKMQAQNLTVLKGLSGSSSLRVES